MIDYACIFTTGGAVLWCKTFCDTQYKLDVVNLFVKNVLLDEKTALQNAGTGALGAASASSSHRPTSYNFQDNVLRWKIMMESDFKIVFAIVYKQILHLTMIDDLLEMLKIDFEENVWPKVVKQSGVIMTLPSNYEERFSKRMIQWEKQKQQQSENGGTAGGPKKMRTFDNSRLSKKAQRKADKKQQIMENGQGNSDSPDDQALDNSTAAESQMTAKQRAELKFRNSKKKSSGNNSQAKPSQDANGGAEAYDPDLEYRRKMEFMRGPKKSVTQADMDQIDHSIGVPDDEQEHADKIAQMRKEYIEDANDDDIRDIGFIDSDDEIDLSKIRSLNKQKQLEEATEEAPSLFGRLTSAFQNYTGNRTLTKSDLKPILKEFSENLTEKNVSAEIAQEICTSVEQRLVDTKTASFTTIRATIQDALVDSIQKLLTPKKNIDILKEALSAKKKGVVYSIVFIGVNGVGKSTSLAKTAYYLKTKGNLRVMMAGCDNFRSGAIEQLETHANCLEVPLYQKGYKDDPAIIAKEALQDAKNKKYDVVLIDTAGRMQGNEALMRALAKLVHVNKPDTVLFVGEALVGNDAIDQLTKFNQSLIDFAVQDQNPRVIDGIIMTKFDTVDEKVGTALNMVYTTGKPIVFVGIGQKYPHLRKLNVQTVVNALMS